MGLTAGTAARVRGISGTPKGAVMVGMTGRCVKSKQEQDSLLNESVKLMGSR